jgi:hypothetical protein
METVIIKSVTDGRRTGRTSPYHNTSRFQWAYKKDKEQIVLQHSNFEMQYYTIMDLLPVEYAVLLTRKSDIDRGEAEVNI